MAANKNLQNAKVDPYDEYFTMLTDIENEMRYYRQHFKDKVVFCNCDDPEYSNFWKYFELNFEFFGLKKLISTHYHKDRPTYKLELTRDENGDGKIDKYDIVKTPLKGNGDFRSPECMEMLQNADIITTNPPFSLWSDFLQTLIESEKEFIIIGNYNAITYRDTFEYIKDNKLWTGVSPRSMDFKLPSGEMKSINAKWFTNLDVPTRHKELIPFRVYEGNEGNYPKYANYDAINIDKTNDIPVDYFGEMGVPITFLEKHNPEQFEIVGISRDLAKPMSEFAEKGEYMAGGPRFYLKEQHGKYLYRRLYDRVVIRRKTD